jgi:UDP-N-acetylmuramoylalanine--D-glutamate ligase
MTRSEAFDPGARVAILGLGVSGTAAARLARRQGARVYASDSASGTGQREAAAVLQALGIEAEVGGHDMERILASDLVVTSPGIGPFSEVRQAVTRAGIPTIAEVELAYRSLRSRIIGITGTNGKTTATQLTTHLLTSSGIRAEAVGNVGRPLSECALSEDQPDWVVVELSSFQLADLDRFETEIGVLLNLAPDHLDRYRDLDSYYADKGRLFERASESPAWVLNADDSAVLELAEGAAGERYLFSTETEVDLGAWIGSEETLLGRLEPESAPRGWGTLADLRLLGRHNRANALAACVAAALAGADPNRFGEALRSFEGLPHRLQAVADRSGVLWVDDSKATNVAAAVAAVTAFDRPLILLLGGRHKGQPYDAIADAAKGRARAVIAFGEAAPLIVPALQEAVETIVTETGLDAAVRAAAGLARSGDVVLLAPACSSYDMFPDYAARGRAFEAAVHALPDPGENA